MLRNYLLVACRSLLRHRLPAAVNVAGLSLGIAACLSFAVLLRHELSFDAQHERADRIHRVLAGTRTDGGDVDYSVRTGGRLGAIATDRFPQVEAAVRVLPWAMWVGHEGRGFHQMVCVADADLLDVFTFPLVAGDAATALRQSGGVLLTERTGAQAVRRGRPDGSRGDHRR